MKPTRPDLPKHFARPRRTPTLLGVAPPVSVAELPGGSYRTRRNARTADAIRTDVVLLRGRGAK